MDRENPYRRNIIVLWYCSTVFYMIVLVASTVVLVFGVAGVFVAEGQPEYKPFFLLPLTLSFLGGIVFLINLLRLLSRFTEGSGIRE
jgi:hypothetical protein